MAIDIARKFKDSTNYREDCCLRIPTLEHRYMEDTMVECGDHIHVFSSHSLRMKKAPIMAMNLSQPVIPVITGLLIAVNSTLTQADVIPKILHRQSKVGVRYIDECQS